MLRAGGRPALWGSSWENAFPAPLVRFLASACHASGLRARIVPELRQYKSIGFGRLRPETHEGLRPKLHFEVNSLFTKRCRERSML